MEEWGSLINPHQTKGGVVATPPKFFFPGFFRRIKTQKQPTPGILVISFTFFAVILMFKKIRGVPPWVGVRVVGQSRGVGGFLQPKLI